MTEELIARARAGDGAAFRELVEPHRRELHVHCYRILGSYHDAEDALQDVLFAAWNGFPGYEGRAALRTWLYRIATNRCLNLRRTQARRPSDLPPNLPAHTGVGEVVWLEPYPGAPGPDALYEETESISLAFVTALQTLPPRQLAVLVLRDVLGFPAAEVAGMLDATVESVTSALKRARATMRGLTAGDPPPAAGSEAEDAIVAKFVRAYESADVPALVALLTDDAFVSMPPLPFEYRGHEAIARLYTDVFASGTRFLVPARANGQPAFGIYTDTQPAYIRRGTGFLVIGLSGPRINSMIRFDSAMLAPFGLPRSMPPS